jgi:hypothetical protein
MLYRSVDDDAHCRWASSNKTRRSAWESDLGADHIRRLLLHHGLGARREDAVCAGARWPATANTCNCDVGGRQQRHCDEANLDERVRNVTAERLALRRPAVHAFTSSPAVY